MAKKSMILYGRNSILERLKARPQSIHKILLQENIDLPQIDELARRHVIAVERLTAQHLLRVKPTKDLQGAVAKVDKFEYLPFKQLLAQQDREMTLIFLDRINDPQNLGVILRMAACFGKFAVVIPRFDACEVTETVLHVACGGENYIPVSLVTNLTSSIVQAKEAGYWIVGTVVDEAEELGKKELPQPLALVLGSEADGIRHGLQKHLDFKVRIPMQGEPLSFNVAVACSICCYEITRQKRIAK